MTVLRYVVAVLVLLGLTGCALVVGPLLVRSAEWARAARHADSRTRRAEAELAILHVQHDTERQLWSTALDDAQGRSR